MTARDEVLGRIRAALSNGAAGPEVTRNYRLAGEHPPGAAALLDLLTDRLEDYHATVHRCGPAFLSTTITSALAADGGVRNIVVPPGLPREWFEDARDLTVIADHPTGTDSAASPVPAQGSLDVATLDALDGVVTACAVAIAETGTIALDGSSDQGRRVITLVPDFHLVVVRAEQVVQTVPEALARLDPRRPLTLISGPSATSDIELSRVEGVHGPRTLVVVLVDN